MSEIPLSLRARWKAQRIAERVGLGGLFDAGGPFDYDHGLQHWPGLLRHRLWLWWVSGYNDNLRCPGCGRGAKLDADGEEIYIVCRSVADGDVGVPEACANWEPNPSLANIRRVAYFTNWRETKPAWFEQRQLT